MKNRIAALRKRRGLTQQQLATEADCDKSTIFRYERGETSLFQKNVATIATILGLDSPDQLVGPDILSARLTGTVGAGAEVFPLDDDTEFLTAPPHMDNPIAVRVVGNSMVPVYREGDILFAETRSYVGSEVIGLDCIVQVTDGPRLVKRVLRGAQQGKFLLFSYETHEVSDELELDWASPVLWVNRGWRPTRPNRS